ncbi:hypothetical protein GS682_26215 [Nostoc sp. B(2019)]|nr:hypothetical protein [Nostoc sp. B(2019)]
MMLASCAVYQAISIGESDRHVGFSVVLSIYAGEYCSEYCPPKLANTIPTEPCAVIPV